MTEMVEELCTSAPSLRIYEKVFGKMKNVESALVQLYESVLDFFVEALDYEKRCAASKLSYRDTFILWKSKTMEANDFQDLT